MPGRPFRAGPFRSLHPQAFVSPIDEHVVSAPAAAVSVNAVAPVPVLTPIAVAGVETVSAPAPVPSLAAVVPAASETLTSPAPVPSVTAIAPAAAIAVASPSETDDTTVVVPAAAVSVAAPDATVVTEVVEAPVLPQRVLGLPDIEYEALEHVVRTPSAQVYVDTPDPQIVTWEPQETPIEPPPIPLTRKVTLTPEPVVEAPVSVPEPRVQPRVTVTTVSAAVTVMASPASVEIVPLQQYEEEDAMALLVLA